MRRARFHKYTPAAGLPELREAVAAKAARDSGYAINASQVLITNGGKHAVYEAFATLLDPGDEVLLPTPYWTTYPEAIGLAGGVPVPVMTDERSGYRASAADLEAACTSRTKLLVFVSPSNPTGAVYPPGQVAERPWTSRASYRARPAPKRQRLWRESRRGSAGRRTAGCRRGCR